MIRLAADEKCATNRTRLLVTDDQSRNQTLQALKEMVGNVTLNGLIKLHVGISASNIALPNLVFCYVVVDFGIGQRSSLVAMMIIHPCATHSCIAVGLRLL